MKDWNWKTIGIVALIVGVLAWWPPTRAIIRVILPLGRGLDDFIVLAAMALGLIVWGARSWNSWKAKRDVAHLNKKANWKLRASVFTGIVLAVWFILPPTNMVLRNFMLGKPITDSFALIMSGVYAFGLFVVWLILSMKGKS